MAAAPNVLAAFRGLEIGTLGEKIRDLGLYGLSQQRACALSQDFGELSVKASWLNQFGHVIVGHGISLLGWRSGGFMHAHDMPRFRFSPSPSSGDSSSAELAVQARCSFNETSLEERSWLEKRIGASLSKSLDWRHRD